MQSLLTESSHSAMRLYGACVCALWELTVVEPHSGLSWKTPQFLLPQQPAGHRHSQAKRQRRPWVSGRPWLNITQTLVLPLSSEPRAYESNMKEVPQQLS